MIKTRADIETLFRFAIVGGSFSLLYAGLTATLTTYAGLAALPTSMSVYTLCIPAAYWFQRTFAFRAAGRDRRSFLIYAVTQVACLTFVSAITTRFVTGMFLTDSMLFILTAGLAAVGSFAICRFVIFRQPR